MILLRAAIGTEIISFVNVLMNDVNLIFQSKKVKCERIEKKMPL